MISDMFRIAELFEFVAEDLTGRRLYTLCHAEDVRLLRKAHTDCYYSIIFIVLELILLKSESFLTVMHKGQVMTPYYRILNRHGGFT